MSRSAWLSGARWRDGLFIPGVEPSRAADLLLGPSAVRVSRAPEASELSWDDFEVSSTMWDSRPASALADSWSYVQYATSRSGPIGVALGLKGRHVAETAALRRRVGGWRTRFDRILEDGTVVPLHAKSIGGGDGLDSIRVLGSLLSRFKVIRAGLRDQAAVEAVAASLRADEFRPAIEATGLRRSTVDILAALRSAGFSFSVGGRPLPWEQRLDTDEAVNRVLGHLHASPYTRDQNYTEQQVRPLVEQHYTTVPEWPVAPLVTEAQEST